MVSPRTKFLFLACALLFLLHRWWLPLGAMLYDLAALPARWNNASARSVISQERDHFDITFVAYDINQSTAGAGYADAVPPILHHINLGTKPPRAEWVAARMNCLKHHEGWQSYLWDDASANMFVQEHYPHLKDMWDNYRYPVQRVDALRYMVLQKYGGEPL
jgi:mannosyltransferase OCH1-like enzyme